jgi:hypothetical protein
MVSAPVKASKCATIWCIHLNTHGRSKRVLACRLFTHLKPKRSVSSIGPRAGFVRQVHIPILIFIACSCCADASVHGPAIPAIVELSHRPLLVSAHAGIEKRKIHRIKANRANTMTYLLWQTGLKP